MLPGGTLYFLLWEHPARRFRLNISCVFQQEERRKIREQTRSLYSRGITANNGERQLFALTPGTMYVLVFYSLEHKKNLSDHDDILYEGTFSILAHIERDADVPLSWIDSDPKLITDDIQQVRLRSFATNSHQVDSLIAYRMQDPAS